MVIFVRKTSESFFESQIELWLAAGFEPEPLVSKRTSLKVKMTFLIEINEPLWFLSCCGILNTKITYTKNTETSINEERNQEYKNHLLKIERLA